MDQTRNMDPLKTLPLSNCSIQLPIINSRNLPAFSPNNLFIPSSSLSSSIPQINSRLIINLPLSPSTLDNFQPASCTKSIGDFNRRRTRHLMQHPLVEQTINIENSRHRRHRKSVTETLGRSEKNSLSLLEYQKMLKDSRRLDIELRKKSHTKQLVEVIEGQTCLTAQKQNVQENSYENEQDDDEKNFSEFKNILLNHQSCNLEKNHNERILRKCQSDNLITEKRKGVNRQIYRRTTTSPNVPTSSVTTHRSDHCTDISTSTSNRHSVSSSTVTSSKNTAKRCFLTQSHRANSLHYTHAFPPNSSQSDASNKVPQPLSSPPTNSSLSNKPQIFPRKLPGRPSQLSLDVIEDNLKAKQLPPIIKKQTEANSMPKYIDQLKTLKNNKDFYYSIKTNTIYPKANTTTQNGLKTHKKPNNPSNTNKKKKYANKKPYANSNLTNKPLSLHELRRLSKVSEDDNYGVYSSNYAPKKRSLGPCNSPIYFEPSAATLPPLIKLSASPQTNYLNNHDNGSDSVRNKLYS